MAIVKTDPSETGSTNVVQLDSDAESNREAIHEIEEWASQNGFARVNEAWLRQVRRNGKRYFRGICYRLTEEEVAGSVSAIRLSPELPDSFSEPRTGADSD